MKKYLLIVLAFVSLSIFGDSNLPYRHQEIVLQLNTVHAIMLSYVPQVSQTNSNVLSLQYDYSSKNIIVKTLNYGSTRVTIADQGGVQDVYDINVYPQKWNVYNELIENYPNLKLSLKDKMIVISGKISSIDEVYLLKRIMELDEYSDDIVDNTILDYVQIVKDAENFLIEHNFHLINIKMLNNIVFVTGEVYDLQRQAQLIDLLTEYFSGFNCNVNYAGVNITNRKINMRISFVDIDKSKLNQFGIQTTSPIQWSLAFGELANYFSFGDNSNGVTISNISGVIDVLQQNKVAKIVYENQLSTLSGEKAEFQQGGVLNVKVASTDTAELREIEYGFQVDVTPYTIDDDTIGIDFSMEQVRPQNQDSWTSTEQDKDLSKYKTKSKYTMKAGSEKVISSIISTGVSTSASGLPWLVDLSSWFFGSTSDGGSEHEMLLILQVDWENSDNLDLLNTKEKIQDIKNESRETLERSSIK